MPMLTPGTQIQAPVRAYGGFCIPPEGPAAIPLQWVFTTGAQEFEADITNFLQTQNISYIQSMFVDNSQNAQALAIYVPTSGQTIRVLPGSQGYLALLAPNPPRIIFSSAVAVDTPCRVTLLNFPLSNEVWGANPLIPSATVSIPALETLIAGGFMPVLNQGVINTGIVPEAFANLRATLTKTTTTSQNVIAAPGAGLCLWVEAIQVSLSGDAAMAAPGVQTLTVRHTTATEILRRSTYLSGTPVAGMSVGAEYPIRQRFAEDSALTAILNTALTAGSWQINVSYSVVSV